jgi:hypothetical protein
MMIHQLHRWKMPRGLRKRLTPPAFIIPTRQLLPSLTVRTVQPWKASQIPRDDKFNQTSKRLVKGFPERPSTIPKIPGETRWNGWLLMIEEAFRTKAYPRRVVYTICRCLRTGYAYIRRLNTV